MSYCRLYNLKVFFFFFTELAHFAEMSIKWSYKEKSKKKNYNLVSLVSPFP